MPELTLESLAKRIEELEQKSARFEAPIVKDWMRAAGLFSVSELSKQIDQEGHKIREADRAAARQEVRG